MYPMTNTPGVIIMSETQTLQEYAAATNTHPRTVKRWLADDLLPGAHKDPVTGLWAIPAGARRTPPQQVTLPRREPAAQVEHVQPVPTGINWDSMPTFLTLPQAARLMHPITERAIANNPDYFGVVELTIEGSSGHARKMVPLRTLKKLRGVKS
jgi:hypothetical protein